LALLRAVDAAEVDTCGVEKTTSASPQAYT
jgi:hypothetical protein